MAKKRTTKKETGKKAASTNAYEVRANEERKTTKPGGVRAAERGYE